MEPQSPPDPSHGRRIWLILGITLAAVIVLRILGGIALSAVSTHWVQSYRIVSGSMEPTLLVGDHIFVSKRSFRKRGPDRGEMVVFRYPRDLNREFVDRVVAVGGDRLEIRDKKLFLNGHPVDEPYAVHNDPKVFEPSPFQPFAQRDNLGPLLVPDGAVFVMGDNRDNSNDSRFYGPVDRSLVIGQPTSIYWSWDSQTGEVRWDRIGRSLR